MSHRLLSPFGRTGARCRSRALAGGLVLLGLSACLTTTEEATPPGSVPPQPQEGAARPGGQGAKRVPDRADLELEVEKKVREIDVATLEVEVGKQKSRSEEAAAADAVAAAIREHGAAVQALEHYSQFEKVALLADAQLKIDRAAFSLSSRQQELEQMQREYGVFENDEHAVETGKIVIARSKKMVEFQQRSLDLETGRRKALADFAIPQKLAKLEGEVAKQESALARAKEALERKSFEAELMVTKAENKLTLTRLELARAQKRLAKID
jgi:hypothetical protein